jgi:hypothetical protein
MIFLNLDDLGLLGFLFMELSVVSIVKPFIVTLYDERNTQK